MHVLIRLHCAYSLRAHSVAFSSQHIPHDFHCHPGNYTLGSQTSPFSITVRPPACEAKQPALTLLSQQGPNMSTNGIRTLIKPSTITMETTTAAPLLSTSTTMPPLPSKFASPLPAAHQASHQATPTIAALALAAVVLFAFILLSALLYFTALRVQGRYPNCPCFEGQRNGSQNSGLALITPQRVQERMRGQDIEMGPMDAQAQIYRDRMRMRSLAHLEGQNTATVESETNTVNAGEGETRENEETTSTLR